LPQSGLGYQIPDTLLRKLLNSKSFHEVLQKVSFLGGRLLYIIANEKPPRFDVVHVNNVSDIPVLKRILRMIATWILTFSISQ
jgi:hypothetical protein